MYKALYLVLSIVIGVYILFSVVKTDDLSVEELKQKYANQESKFMKIDDVDVHYRQEGTGPNLLFVHGTASSLHTWEGWVNELQNDFTITRLDLPAFGLTGPHPDAEYSIDFYVNFLHEFVTELQLDSLSIAGNSLGGGISWSYTLAHPEVVQKLVLLDASGYPSDDEPFVFTIAKNDLTAGILKSVTPRSFIEKNIKEVYYDESKITSDLVDRYHQLTLRSGNRQAFIDRARQPLGYEYHRISEIAAPTLILWGEYDEWVLLENAYQFEKDIKNSKLIIYEAGHVPMEEIPEQSARDIREFLLTF